MDLFPTLGGGQQSPLRRAVDQTADAFEIALRDALLHIDADPVMRGDRDQAMPAAVADVEADPRALAIDLGKGLAVFAVAEGERAVFAAQPLAETDAQRRTA